MDQGASPNSSDMDVDQIRTRSDVEETATHNTKVSDSGYSNSCSNSQSQRSSGSSKSRHSTSSGSSGYCGRTSPLNINDGGAQAKRKEKEHKKKKNKNNSSASSVQQLLVEEANNNTPQQNEDDKNGNQLMDTSVLPIDNDVLQIAILSQTLSSMKKMKHQILDESAGSPGETPNLPIIDINLDQLASGIKQESLEEDELKIVVSMSDGVVVFTSGLATVLDYPKEMWLGRSLIDFVQPKHRATFAGHITTAIANLRPGSNTNQKNVFFCCLRMYRGLKSTGFNVSEKSVPYLPCQLSLTFQELTAKGETVAKEYLIITATPVRSAYKCRWQAFSPTVGRDSSTPFFLADPVETNVSPKFMTRHSASCQLNHLDPEVLPYFGYLPQDLLGRSILDFYHPEDLHFIKEVYEAVMKEQGHPFRSKPYRFRCQNGDYALVETELSSFINPWSRKLEFIIGQHSVLRGPRNPDVVTPVSIPEPLQISAEVLKETKIVQEEIKCLLNETVVRTSETAKQQVSKRCKDLAAFMENLMDEITKPPDLKVDVPIEEQSFSERDSVMLGEISPHHDYYDSKSSSETPPSYNQLNYNENIQRFFESKPKTTLSEESADPKNGSAIGEGGKISPVINLSTMSKSGGSGTSPWQSTESHGNSGETTTNTSNNTLQSCKPPTLTEQLLIRCLLDRHNEDMEKQMVQKHREMRNKSDRDSKVKERLKDKVQDMSKGCFNTEEQLCCPSSGHHGLKRSGSHSWDGEPYKSIKASHTNNGQTQASSSEQTAALPQPSNPSKPKETNQPSLWPPFSVSLTPVQSSRQDYSGFASALMPMYYVTNPRPEGASPYHQHPAYLTQQLQYVPSMLYHPIMFGTPPMMYSPLTVYPSPVYPGANGERTTLLQQTRTAAQGTSNKVEHGSQHSQMAATHQDKTGLLNERIQVNARSDQKTDPEADSTETSVPCDDSSYHSSFYSFLKTDKSDSSLKSSSENDKTEEVSWPTSSKPRPIRKVAPWVEDINVTPELILRYQLEERELDEVLKEDLLLLERIHQPNLVNDQLNQMYIDLELEGLSKQLTLEELSSSSELSNDEAKPTSYSAQQKKTRSYMEYDRMTILFEEDAPMPPPPLSA
ncbi:period circadian protein isoform X2 [Cimex lectularius]|uniref:Period circadian protein n=1 Tax=Cimex lectularius TaxID=79782 RepID=A0A8I6TIG1_CIMLE|nr:period circadian protein isoform X2 [Cimex lectularius]